ncbi:GFA family protein [Pleurocapsa sp. FMAR1]|uniref:hypothetical protein n=1 Tax=Pleurocapsa sp. FMAR1 TaxID=3040204 RepID=UPI0029C6CDB4|nr:hypothetical protein [Pleurocapsa sp. FMAR1]
MANLKGECLCGKIRYEYCGAMGNLVHCHCLSRAFPCVFRRRGVARQNAVNGMVQHLEAVW